MELNRKQLPFNIPPVLDEGRGEKRRTSLVGVEEEVKQYYLSSNFVLATAITAALIC